MTGKYDKFHGFYHIYQIAWLLLILTAVGYLRHLDGLRDAFERRFRYEAVRNENVPVSDFDVIRTLGRGGFCVVYLVRNKQNLKYHAMKATEKEAMVNNNFVKNLLLEKKILLSSDFPFVIYAKYICKDNVYIYFLLPLASGGDLRRFIRKNGHLPEDMALFYAAQIVLALEYLHHCDIIHRDVKPENIFIYEDGYIKIADFGLSKKTQGKAHTLCGTPEYLAPELIISKGYSVGVDWWAFGIFIYEMVQGNVPFLDSNPTKLYNKILSCNYKLPSNASNACKNLIRKILILNPSNRLGCLSGGASDIKINPWFNSIDFGALYRQRYEPPYIPPSEAELGRVPIDDDKEVLLKQSEKCLFEEEFSDF